MSLPFLLALLFNGTLLLVCCYALICGGRPERIGATINLVATALTFALRSQSETQQVPLDALIFAVDLAVAAGFYWLSFTTIRFWPIWATGFALANLLTSISGALLIGFPVFAYLTGVGIYAYLALGALALGTLRLPRDADPYLRNGSRRSWLQHQRSTI